MADPRLIELIRPHLEKARQAGYDAGYAEASRRLLEVVPTMVQPISKSFRTKKYTPTKPITKAKKSAEPGSDDPHGVLLAAMLQHAAECAETGDDPGEMLDWLADLAHDPERMADVLSGAGKAAVKCIGLLILKGKWDEDKHPRGKNGRFLSKDRIQAAATDPKVKAELEKEVRPEDAGKLKAAIEDQGGTIGRTKRGEAKFQAGQRRAAQKLALGEARKIAEKIAGGEGTVEDVDTLASHLKAGLSSDHIRLLQSTVGGSGRKKADMITSLLDAARDAVSQPKSTTSEPEQAATKTHKPGTVRSVHPDNLKVDPKRFQFKLNTANPAGVTDELKTVQEWNPDFAGVIAVWQDPKDGNTYVVNGHHRYELATRLGAKNLAVRYLDAKDEKEARAKGALINIAEGRGTAVDAAKFMRDMGVTVDDFAKHGVPLKQGALADQATTLTKLNDKAFDRLTRGDLDISKALAVAKHLKDPDRQERLFGLLEKREDEGKDISSRTMEEMARAMSEVPSVTKTENTLWGPEETTEDVFIQRAELAGHVRAELAKELGDYAVLASQRRADTTRDAGNVLNVDENKKRAESAEQAKNLYDQLVNRKGPISDVLNDAALKLANAKTKKERERVRSETATAVRSAIQAEFAALERKPKTDGRGEGQPIPQSGRLDQSGTEDIKSGSGNNQPVGVAAPETPEPAAEVQTPETPEPVSKPTDSNDQVQDDKKFSGWRGGPNVLSPALWHRTFGNALTEITAGQSKYPGGTGKWIADNMDKLKLRYEMGLSPEQAAEDLAVFVREYKSSPGNDLSRARELSAQKIRELKERQNQPETPEPAAEVPTKTQLASGNPEPLDLSVDNVEPVWAKMRDEITAHDPKISPAHAGALATARIMSNVSNAANKFMDEIDERDRTGKPISDEESDKYDRVRDMSRKLKQRLVELSGYRPHPEVDNHPLANRPFDAEPLTVANQVKADRDAEFARQNQPETPEPVAAEVQTPDADTGGDAPAQEPVASAPAAATEPTAPVANAEPEPAPPALAPEAAKVPAAKPQPGMKSRGQSLTEVDKRVAAIHKEIKAGSPTVGSEVAVQGLDGKHKLLSISRDGKTATVIPSKLSDEQKKFLKRNPNAYRRKVPVSDLVNAKNENTLRLLSNARELANSGNYQLAHTILDGLNAPKADKLTASGDPAPKVKPVAPAPAPVVEDDDAPIQLGAPEPMPTPAAPAQASAPTPKPTKPQSTAGTEPVPPGMAEHLGNMGDRKFFRDDKGDVYSLGKGDTKPRLWDRKADWEQSEHAGALAGGHQSLEDYRDSLNPLPENATHGQRVMQKFTSPGDVISGKRIRQAFPDLNDEQVDKVLFDLMSNNKIRMYVDGDQEALKASGRGVFIRDRLWSTGSLNEGTTAADIDAAVQRITGQESAPAPQSASSGVTPQVDAAVAKWSDSSKPITERLDELTRVDTSILDAVRRGGYLGKDGMPGHNEVFRTLSKTYDDYKSSVADGLADPERLEERFDSITQRLPGYVNGLRALADKGVSVRDYVGNTIGPDQLRAAADLYEKHVPEAMAAIRKEYGLPASAAPKPVVTAGGSPQPAQSGTPQNPPTVVDNPTSGADNTPVASQSAGNTQGGQTMNATDPLVTPTGHKIQDMKNGEYKVQFGGDFAVFNRRGKLVNASMYFTPPGDAVKEIGDHIAAMNGGGSPPLTPAQSATGNSDNYGKSHTARFKIKPTNSRDFSKITAALRKAGAKFDSDSKEWRIPAEDLHKVSGIYGLQRLMDMNEADLGYHDWQQGGGVA